MEFYINKNHWKKFWKKHGRVKEAAFAASLQTFLNEVNQDPKKFDQIREKYPNLIKIEGASVYSLKPLGTDSKVRLPCALNRKDDLIAEQFCMDHDRTYQSALTTLKSKGPILSEGMISLTSTLKSLSLVGEETPDAGKTQQQSDQKKPPINLPQHPLPPQGGRG